jgi:hypothetical protein
VGKGTGDEVGVRLVLGVSRLGEADLFGWWGSRGCSEAGRYVLGGAFPRTWAVSALQLAVISAALRHEEELKGPKAVHLFSDQLPFKRLALHWLGEQKLAAEPDALVARLQGWNKDTACADLAEWAALPPPAGEPLGPGQRLGAVPAGDLQQPGPREQVARTLAAWYAWAAGTLRLPYYDRSP